MENILNEIRKEREHQDQKFGTEFYDRNTINDWNAYLTIHLANAVKMGTSKEEQRRQLMKVATLGVAALQAFDRNDGFPPRHYDDP